MNFDDLKKNKFLKNFITSHVYENIEKNRIISCREKNSGFTFTIYQQEKAILFCLDSSFSGNKNCQAINCVKEKNKKCIEIKGKKCDFLLYFEEKSSDNYLLFIELKGNKFEEAVKQLIETKKLLKQKAIDLSNISNVAVLITTKIKSAPVKTKSKELKNSFEKVIIGKGDKFDIRKKEIFCK